MKNLLYFFASIILTTACTSSEKSDRDDDKYLGTWNGHLSYGSYFGVTTTLNGRSDFPYDIVVFNYDSATKKKSAMEKSPFKISGNRLIGETMVDGTLPTFSINDSDNTFRYFGFNRVTGLTKNHTK